MHAKGGPTTDSPSAGGFTRSGKSECEFLVALGPPATVEYSLWERQCSEGATIAGGNSAPKFS